MPLPKGCIPTRFFAVLVLFALTTGCSSSHPALSNSSQLPADAWIRTELFFGLSEAGQPIPDTQWRDFVDRSITPRFPDGLTILHGAGQYRGDDHQVHREPTAILILLHQQETRQRDDALLNAIAQDYNQRFHQQSVLRCDSPAQVRFIVPF